MWTQEIKGKNPPWLSVYAIMRMRLEALSSAFVQERERERDWVV